MAGWPQGCWQEVGKAGWGRLLRAEAILGRTSRTWGQMARGRRREAKTEAAGSRRRVRRCLQPRLVWVGPCQHFGGDLSPVSTLGVTQSCCPQHREGTLAEPQHGRQQALVASPAFLQHLVPPFTGQSLLNASGLLVSFSSHMAFPAVAPIFNLFNEISFPVIPETGNL